MVWIESWMKGSNFACAFQSDAAQPREPGPHSAFMCCEMALNGCCNPGVRLVCAISQGGAIRGGAPVAALPALYPGLFRSGWIVWQLGWQSRFLPHSPLSPIFNALAQRSNCPTSQEVVKNYMLKCKPCNTNEIQQSPQRGNRVWINFRAVIGSDLAGMIGAALSRSPARPM